MLNVFLQLAREKTYQTPTHASTRRESLINFVYKQCRTKQLISDSYKKLRNAFKKMHDSYSSAKGRNVFAKYIQMRNMISEVVILDKQYWQLIEVPAPEKSEPCPEYVNRVIDIVSVTNTARPQRSGIAGLLSAALLTSNTTDCIVFDSLQRLSACDLSKECDRLYTELYKLIRKYLALRGVLRKLRSDFLSSRFLPIIPRYGMLKSMIKAVIRDPIFVEIYHEQD